ncbi:MAG TPA: DNA damage-inducible protein D, partial [Firmicutes bacterium]|nr:DNA damage-inducible protein D [Bacillota bacterium]
KNNFCGEILITDEHVKNNQDVRNLLAKSNIHPEELPPEEDIKKLERRVKADDKKLASVTTKLKRD